MRSPLRRLVGRQVILLRFSGRRSGREYVLPVGRHEVGGRLLSVTGSEWRLNFRGGAPVEVLLDGRWRSGRGVLVEDPDQVVDVYRDLIRQYGRKGGTRLGLRIDVDGTPSADAIRRAVEGRSFVRFELA